MGPRVSSRLSLARKPTGGLQLLLGVVYSHNVRTQTRHPGADLSGAATKLDGVHAAHIIRQRPPHLLMRPRYPDRDSHFSQDYNYQLFADSVAKEILPARVADAETARKAEEVMARLGLEALRERHLASRSPTTTSSRPASLIELP